MLQCFAVRCIVAVWCSMLKCVAVKSEDFGAACVSLSTTLPVQSLLLTLVCDSVLQRVAVCCSMLQCAAVCCSVLLMLVLCSVLLTLVWCSVLQYGAVWCSVVQCVAVCCSTI